MTINLNPHLEEIINRKVANGEFDSVSDIVNTALVHYLHNEPEDPLPPEQLREELIRAEAQFERGEYSTYNDETFREFIEQVKIEGRKKLAAQPQTKS